MSFTLAFAASLYLAAAVYVFGSRRPGYDHIKHTISELGESGSIYCRVVSYGVFVLVAALLFGVAGLSVSTDPPHALLTLSISVGYMAAALVLSFESPIQGITQRFAETILFAGLCYAVWTPCMNAFGPTEPVTRKMNERPLFAGAAFQTFVSDDASLTDRFTSHSRPSIDPSYTFRCRPICDVRVGF